jgi:hypothetical protein
MYMKKNTLLYLDEDLVRSAKKNGINISKATETAIKSLLFPYLSLGEKAALNFDKYLDDLEEEGRVHYLPFKIESLSAENLGPIKKLDLKFKNKNIIFGGNASGKTILLNVIAHSFGKKANNLEWMSDKGNNKFKLKLEFEGNDLFIETNFEKDYKSILIDGGLERLSEEPLNKFLKYLLKLDYQVILTTASFPESKFSRDFNRVSL